MKTTILSICLTLLFAAPVFGQTYSAALAKLDHVYIGEDYNADQASTTVADEVGSNDCTLQGGDNAGDLDGTSGSGPTAWLDRSLDLDGTADYLLTTSSIDLTGPFTIVAWVRRDDASTNDTLVADDGSFNNYIRHRTVVQQLEYRVGGNGAETGNVGVNFTTGWHHLAITRDGSDNLDFYADGALVLDNHTTESGTFPIDSIGAMNGGQHLMGGLISQVGIADEALTATDIAQLYAGPPAGPSAPIIHHYRQRMSYLQWRDELNQDDRWSLALAP